MNRVSFLKRIHALSEISGHCYAGNAYLAREHKVNSRTIRRWLESEIQAGTIERTLHGRKRELRITKAGVRLMSAMCPPDVRLMPAYAHISSYLSYLYDRTLSFLSRAKRAMTGIVQKTDSSDMVGDVLLEHSTFGRPLTIQPQTRKGEMSA